MANGFPRLNIVLFNTDGDKGVTAPDRHECMKTILDTILVEDYPNLFILAQDKINGPKHNKLCEKLDLDPNSILYREKGAVVYYNNDTNTHYNGEYVDIAELQQVDDALEYEGGNDFTVARLTACVLTPTADTEMGKILLVSWHGPKNTLCPPAKRACFKCLVLFLERLKDQKGCDMVIVGGDFNLPAGEARQELDQIEVNGEVSASYTPTEDRPNGDPIDYVVYWPRDCLQLTAPVSVVMPDFRRVRYNRPFDHNILLYRLEDIKPFSDLARQFGCITVYEDEE